MCRHRGKEKGLREAISLYKALQQMAEDIHGIRTNHSAMALRSIADVHLLLKEYGEHHSHFTCRCSLCQGQNI